MLAAHLEGDVACEPWVQTVEYDATIPAKRARLSRALALRFAVPVANCTSLEAMNFSLVAGSGSGAAACRAGP